MNGFIETSVYFGVILSVLAYGIGCWLYKKFKIAVFNPLLISMILVIVVLKLTGVSYDIYYEGAKYISYLLTPATVCLAIPLYEQMELLKKNYKAILLGILSGVIASLGSILLMCCLFGLDHADYVTLLPKSVTTAIGMGISEELGGYATLTVVVIIITGIIGNMIGELVCRIFRITEPIAKGVAMGTSAHGIGTARAIEMGEVEGAISGLSIAVAGLMTVVGASVFAQFM